MAALLLAAPGEDSAGLLEMLAQSRPWLDAARRELAAMPLDEWRAEHARLFLSSHPRTPCAPFESVWREGRMAGPEAEELAALYRSLGLAADGAPPDYLGTMLECAAWLGETPYPGHLRAERVLWSEHLLRWLPRYAGTLEQESRLGLYRGLARELAALCDEMTDA